MNKFEDILKSTELTGYIDFILKPNLRKTWGGAFNGQQFRRKMFLQILKNIDIASIIETGTFRGSTTKFIAENFQGIIQTVEANKRYLGFARMQLLFNRNVRLYHSDSRNFLNTVLPEHSNERNTIFFYLDSHWAQDLPLLDELRIIFKYCINPVIMIDDFCVPRDAGYGYDDYGPGKSLELALVNEITDIPIYKFFPSQNSASETGAKRGCIVVTHSPEMRSMLSRLDTLREHD